MLEHDARFCGSCGKRIDAIAATTIGLPSPVIPKPPAPSAAQAAAPMPAPARAPVGATLAAALSPAHHQDSNPALASTVVADPSIVPVAPAPARPGGSSKAPAPTIPAAAPSIEPSSPAAAIRAAAQKPEQMIGRTLNNRYFVEAKIGEGGFGAVFRGKQIATGREVALKILHPHNVSDSTIVARFRREAEACSKLRDPHTVTTYDFDEAEDGTLFLAMELLRGRSLHQLQKTEGPFPYKRVLGILDQVAQSLGEAHANGIVHRDMKPENVIIERREEQDYVKVLDFGIAKMISGDREVQALTAVGQTLGTLEFMSPEQLRGQTLDGRSDIYALGMMAYEMLTGGLPFKNIKSPIEIINFHMKEPPPPPSQLRPDLEIPESVDDIIQKMVAKSRDQRHASAEELRAHIAAALAGPQKSATSLSSRLSRLPDWSRLPYPMIAAVGGCIVVLGLLIYLLRR
jgi:tRNA A-37 threonylcarbamoyl transferase component Bud32